MRLTHVIALAALLYWFTGCSGVKAFQKGNLADPIMQRTETGVFQKQTLEQKFFSTREGSIGGANGIGGGCGCTK
jgi:hypothetical protein